MLCKYITLLEVCASLLQRTEPGCKISDVEQGEDSSAKHPHHEPSQLLILQGSKPPAYRRFFVGGIPRARGKGHQRTQDSALQDGRKEIQNDRSIMAIFLLSRLKYYPPEQHRSHQK